MRAARRVFRDALSEVIDLERANEELRALATVLGRARDLDVFIGALRRLARTAPAADRPAIKAMVTDLQKQKATAQEELQRALDGGALTYLRSELHGQLQALAGAGAEKGRGASGTACGAPLRASSSGPCDASTGIRTICSPLPRRSSTSGASWPSGPATPWSTSPPPSATPWTSPSPT